MVAGVALIVAMIVVGPVEESETSYLPVPRPTPLTPLTQPTQLAQGAPVPRPSLSAPANLSVQSSVVLIRPEEFPAPLQRRSFVDFAGPCSAAVFPPPVGSEGRAQATPDGSPEYLRQTVVAVPEITTLSFASRVFTGFSACDAFTDGDRAQPYRVTFSKPVELGLGDESVYREATYTPENGTPYTAGWALVRRDNVFVLVDSYFTDGADRARTREMLQRAVARLSLID
jgi:hypothetical protein